MTRQFVTFGTLVLCMMMWGSGCGHQIEKRVLNAEFRATVVEGGAIAATAGDQLTGGFRVPLSLPDLDPSERLGHYETSSANAADVHGEFTWHECCDDDGEIQVIWAHDSVVSDTDGKTRDSFELAWTGPRKDRDGSDLGRYSVQLKLVDSDGEALSDDGLVHRLTLDMFDSATLRIFPAGEEHAALVAQVDSLRTTLTNGTEYGD